MSEKERPSNRCPRLLALFQKRIDGDDALLELARTRRIKIMQNLAFGEIWVTRGELYKADVQLIDQLDVIEEEESELQEQISV